MFAVYCISLNLNFAMEIRREQNENSGGDLENIHMIICIHTMYYIMFTLHTFLEEKP